MHAAYAEWCRNNRHLVDEEFRWKGAAFFKQHLPPIWHEVSTGCDDVSRRVMIRSFVFDLIGGGHRMIMLLPDSFVPEIVLGMHTEVR